MDKLKLDHYFHMDQFTLLDEGTLDTIVFFHPLQMELRYDSQEAAPFRDKDGVLYLEDFLWSIVIPDLECDMDIWEGP